jgi:branched-chain amino acid transport system permease protein
MAAPKPDVPPISVRSRRGPFGFPLPERLPIRRIIQAILLVLIVFVLVVGSFKTLTLPRSHGGFTASAWRDLVVDGVALGSVYALIALGYSLVYGILLMINFAHGEVFMSGAFTSLFVALTLNSNGMLDRDPILSLGLLLVTAICVSTLVAVLLERIAYRPLRNAPRLVPLITAIGASLFLQNTFRGFFGPQTRGYPRIKLFNGRWKILGVPMARTDLVVILTAAVSLLVLWYFVSRTRTGKSMRAVSQDMEMARLMGIDVDRVIMVTFAVGGVLAGVAGVLYAQMFGQVQFTMGFTPGIKAFTAAVLGGIGNVPGAMVGGVLIGLIEAMGGQFIATAWTDVIIFSILVMVLVFKPAGLFGRIAPNKS